MIFVDRNTISLPEVFYSKEIEIAKKRLEEFYVRPKETRSQEKYTRPFEPELRNKFLKALREVFNGKCAYCESAIPLEVIKAEYDHFRPKSGARGFEKEFSTDYYWWLTYEWHNLYYCCPNCNQYKSTWFPIEGARAPINTPYKEIRVLERALMIDPCTDNPEDHFSYTEDGIIEGLTDRGKITIEIIKLNRSDLVQTRSLAALSLKQEFDYFISLFTEEQTNEILIRQVLERWETEVFLKSSEQPYLGLKRELLLKWISKSRSIDWIRSNIDHRVLINRGFRTLKKDEEKVENTQV